MSRAKKCDRCGGFFDPIHMTGDMCLIRNPVFKNSQNVIDGTVGEYFFHGNSADYIDLCPDCAKEFRMFMQGWKVAYKLEENEDIQNVFESYGSDSIKYYYGDKNSNEIGTEDKKEEE